jgi:protein involved in polysaccharide export with SLBB domain
MMFPVLQSHFFRTLTVVFLLWAGVRVHAEPDLDTVDPMARPTTRLAPGYLVNIKVLVRSELEGELSRQYVLDTQGQIRLTIWQRPMPPLTLGGSTVAEAREKVASTVGRYFREMPDVRVTIARMPRLIVQVEGATLGRGTFTLVDGDHLSDALARSGWSPNANLHQVEIIRALGNGTAGKLMANYALALEGDKAESNDPLLRNGDRIVLAGTVTPATLQRVSVAGEVHTPLPALTFRAGMTVRDAIGAAQGTLDTADMEQATIVRRSDGSQISIHLGRAMKDIPTENLPLKPDDTLIVARKDRGKQYAVIGKGVPAASTFDYTKPVSLREAINAAGGLKPDADRQHIQLLRGYVHDVAHPEPVTLNYDKIVKGLAPDVTLLAGDVVMVDTRKKTTPPLLELGLFFLRRLIF